MRRHGSRLLNWSAASRPARPWSLSMCVSPRNLPRLRGTCPVLSTCHWPIYRAGLGNLLRGENRSCWFARPIADPPRRRQRYSPRAYGMSLSFVAEQTDGIGRGCRSNSVGVFWVGNRRLRTDGACAQRRPAHQLRLQAAPPSTQNLAQCGWLSDTAPLAPARLWPRSQSGS